MKEKKSGFLNTLLAVGMLAIFIGYVLILGFAGKSAGFAISVLPVVLFLAGLVFLYVYMAVSKTPFKLFTGLLLSLYGMFSLLIVDSVITAPISSVWPVYLLLTAFSLVAAGRSTGEKFTIKYDLTSIVFLVIGLTLLLFSFHIITVSFKEFMLIAGPVILIVFGIVLIILVERRKNILKILPEDITSELTREENLSGDEAE